MAERVAVVGAGWAGLAAAVEATLLGHQVSLFDMAHTPGGRARTLEGPEGPLDNGQHILIGAYQATLALMRQVGAEPEQLLRRLPLDLRDAQGRGLGLPSGPALLAFIRGVLGWRDVPLSHRLHLLLMASGWQRRGFRCPPDWTVERLCASAPASVYAGLIEPLCVAALNTPADQASAQVLLTVLRDALFGPPGSADLLLPMAPLQALLPAPALAWLKARGAHWVPGARVQALEPAEKHAWRVHGQEFDAVLLATSAREAARLSATLAPGWSAKAAALAYQPIITVWLRHTALHWPRPMLALRTSPLAPAQFGFDLGALGGEPGLFALVISGAADWVAQGAEATARAVQLQLDAEFAGQVAEGTWLQAQVVAVRTEKRATFACVPHLQRPPAAVCPGLWAAGDYVAGPYPATLEGAVLSGQWAARQLNGN